MSDHTLEITASDSAIVEWTDLGDIGDPNRLNAPRQPHRYQRIGFVDGLPMTVTCTATVPVFGAGAMDADLGGELFIWWWSQRGLGPSPAIVPRAAQTSVVDILMQASNVGTWVLTGYRTNHGSVRIGFSVELTEAA